MLLIKIYLPYASRFLVTKQDRSHSVLYTKDTIGIDELTKIELKPFNILRYKII